jgi:hypothetical protein
MRILLKLRFGFTNAGLMIKIRQKVPIYNIIFHMKKHGEDPKKWLNSSIVDPGPNPEVLGAPGSGTFHHHAKIVRKKP